MSSINRPPRKTKQSTISFQQRTRRLFLHVLSVMALSSFLVTAANAARLYVPAITATKTDAFIGGDGDGKADPGETIQYTVTINNSGTAATGVNYTDTIDSNTTLVGGSTSASPAAADDTYPQTVIGNVSIDSSLIPFTVVTNDYLGLNPSATISAYDATSAQGGAVTMTTSGAGIGQFTYDPPAGFTGTDTFTYTLADNANAASAVINRKATVTLSVSGKVWFINNNAGACSASCDGRLSHPFTTLGAFNSINNGTGLHPAANDNIFIYENATAYTGGVTLLGGQKLIGQDASASLVSLTGLTPSSGSAAFPAMNTGAPAVTIQNTSGDAITIDEGNTIRGLTISGTSGAGIKGSSKNALTVGSDVALTSITGSDLDLSGGNGTVDFGANITNNTGRAVLIQNRTGGTITFSGNISDSGGSGIYLNNNAGATVNFTGPLTLSTSANDAFSALGGGTVSATNTTSTLTTTTGTALKVTNTAIGASGLTFRSISSNGAPNGIYLNNTGSSGGLTVTGTGSAGSGGTIKSSAGNDAAGIIPTAGENAGSGIFLYNTKNVALSWMQLNDHANFAIYGNTVNGFTLASSVINGSNGTNASVDEGSVAFDGLTGVVSVSNTSISGGWEDNFRVRNTSGSLNRIIFDTTTIGANNTANGNAGILLDASGAAVLNATVQNSVFTASRGDLFHLNAVGNASSDLVFHTNTLSNNHPAIATGGGGVTIGAGDNTGTVNLTFNIDSNTFRDANGTGVLIFKSTDPGTVQGTFNNNTIGIAAISNSGSVAGDGIKIQNAGLGTVTVKVSNNHIYQYNNFGIDLITGGGASAMSGAFNATVIGNTISNPGTGGLPMNGIMLNGGTVVGDTYAICTDIGGAGGLVNVINGSGANGGTDVRLRQRQATTVRLPGYGGANNDNAAVQNYLITRNSVSPTALSSNTVPTGGGFVGGASCAQPIVMEPGNGQTLAQAQPANTDVVTAAISTDQAASDWSKLIRLETDFATALFSNVRASLANANLSGGKPLFDMIKPSPAQSGETVPVNIGNLPANKSITIIFRVTVNGPQLPLGTLKITNQGTVHSNELANVLTTNGGAVDCETGSETCTPVDRPDTTVSSITRVGGTPTNASSVSWTVTFANPISGLTGSNFVLGPTGLGGTPAITSVTAVGGSPAASWTVVASTGTGDGALGLSLSSDTGLSHDVTNLIFNGQVYNIDRTSPTVANVTSTSNSGCLLNSGITYCNATDVVHISVTFSEVVNVDTTGGTPGLALNSGGTASYVSGAGTNTLTFDYTVAPGQDTSDLDYTSTSALTLNGGSIGDAATNAAIRTLASPNTAGSLGSNSDIDIDTTAPTATNFNRFNPSTTPTNADTLIWQAIFSEEVSGVDGTDFTVPALTGETILASGSADTYNVTVSDGNLPNFNGLVDLDFSASPTIADLAGNPLTNTVVGFDQHYMLDNNNPTVSMTSAANSSTNTSPIPVTVTFSESVTGFTAGDITASNGAVSNFAGSGANYTFDLTPAGQGLVTADIAADVAQDDAGNNNTAAAQFSRTYDSISPSVVMTSTASDPTSNSPIPVTVTFSESVTGFTAGDITTSNGSVSNFAGSGANYTFNLAPAADGIVTADIAAGVAQDAAGNPNTAATQLSRLYDTGAPGVTINQASGQSDPTSASPINFTATFSENVTGFGNVASDVTLSGTAGATTVLVTGGPKIYNVAVSGMTASGTVIASIPAGAALDLASNPNTASTSTDHTVTYIPPTDLNITKTDGVTTATPGGSVTYTITASNAGPNADPSATVADTFPASLTATWTCVGAGGGTCTASGSGNINDTVNLPVGGSVTYTASTTISASATGTMANTATVSASANIFDTNTANNSATDTDSLAPQADLSITKTDGVTTAIPGGSVTYTIKASNAGPSSAPGSTVADTFPASLTGSWTCVGAGGATCTASGSGNINDAVNLPAGGSVTYTVSAAISPAATGTLSNTATVSSAVTDPTPGTNSATDTDTLTPQADLGITKTDGVTVAVAGGSTTYIITASNAGPSNAPGSTVADTFPASLTATWTCVGAGGATCTASGSGNINDTVNLPAGGSVTYTASASVSLSATGTLANTATVSAPGSVTDLVPVNNSATDTDTVAPQVDVTINKASGQADPAKASPINFTVVFASAVTDFDDASDVTLGGTAGATTIVITGGPTTYNVAVSGMTGDGNVTAAIPAGVATGAQGGPNAASTSTDNDVFYDATAPDTTIDAPTPSNPSNSTSATFNFSGNDGSGVGVSSFECKLDNGSFTACSSGQGYTNLSDGSHTFQVRAIDGAGNIDATPASFTWTVDTAGPTVVISTTTNPTNAAPVLVTITFNKDVTGFTPSTAAGDITIGGVGGTDANPQMIDGHTYTFDLTPSGQGTVTVQVPSNSAQDAAGNWNTISNTLDIVYDTVAPTVVSSVRANTSPTSAATVNFTLTFSEPVTGVDAGDFALTTSGLTGTSIANVSGSGATRTVTVNTGVGNGTLRLDVLADGTIMDAASNPLSGAFTAGESYIVQKTWNVGVSIGSVNQWPFYLPSSRGTRQLFTGVNDGPVKVFSSSTSPIVAAERVAYYDGANWTNFSEMMGLPNTLATDTYWFPWYNNVDLNSQLRFANLSNNPVTVTVTIGGAAQPPISLAVGQSTRISYPISNGPVKVQSVGGNIVASNRVAYYDGTAWTSFAETMGVPASQLNTTYWFPWYNNVDLNSQLRFANVSNNPVTVTVTIGGVAQPPISLAVGQSTRISYPISSGVVKVQSVGGNIVASIRIAYNDGTAWTSFAETMGLPNGLLSNAYYFPWYNSVDLSTQLRFGVP